MDKFKQKFLSLSLGVLLIFAVAVPAQAVVPLVVAAWVAGGSLSTYIAGSFLLHGATGAALLAWSMGSNTSTSTKSTTSKPIIRDADVTWVDLSSATPPQPVVKTTPIKATVTMQDFLAVVGVNATPANQLLYPRLHEAVMTTQVDSLNGQTPIVGKTYSGTGYPNFPYFKVTSNQSSAGGFLGESLSYPNGRWYYGMWATYSSSSVNYATGTLTTIAPPPQQKSASLVMNALTGLIANDMNSLPPSPIKSGDVGQSYKDEIDKLLKGEPQIIHYEDEAGNPAVTPSAAITASAADAATRTYVTNTTINNTAATAATAATGARSAATAATAAFNAAADKANAAAINYANSGSEADRLASEAASGAASSARGQMDAANAAAGAADVSSGNAAGAAAAANGAAAGDGKPPDDSTAPVPSSDARKGIDFSKLDALKNALATTYPFNLPSSIGSFYTSFVGTGAAPVFDLPLPLGQIIHVDLSVFNGLAMLCRFLIGTVSSCGVLFYIVHFFRGIS